jgi:predicted negative regulator of RcsB-dependent stress response
VDKEHRKELKTDALVEGVGEATHYVASHQKQVFLYAGIAVVVAALAAGGWWWMNEKKVERQLALGEAMRTAQDSTARNAEQEKKVLASFDKVSSQFSGTQEGNTAKYMTAMLDVERGDVAAGEKKLREIMNGGDKETSSLAKYAVAELVWSQGNINEAEKLFRDLVAAPTYLMPKEQATLQLARILAKTKPDEARKLLEPLRSARSPISAPALQILGTLPPAPMTAPMMKK